MFGFLEGRFAIKVLCFWTLNLLRGFRDSLLSADRQHCVENRRWTEVAEQATGVLLVHPCPSLLGIHGGRWPQANLQKWTVLDLMDYNEFAWTKEGVSRNPVWGLAAHKSTSQGRRSNYQRPQIFITEAWKDTEAQSYWGKIWKLSV